MNKSEAIKYLFENGTNKVRDLRTGIVWYGYHASPVTTVVLSMEQWDAFPDSIFEKIS